MEEIYKDIPGYEGVYQASNLGNIRNIFKNKILKQSTKYNGYKISNLNKKKFYTHRLIAQTFIPNLDNKPQVNHIDGNPRNNNLNNLEWVTRSENILHGIHILGHKSWYSYNHPMKGKFGINHNCSKKVNQYDLDGNFIKTWGGISEASRELNISRNIIYKSINKKNHISYIWEYT